MDWEWEEQSKIDPEDRLRELREGIAEMSLLVERLERAMMWEGSWWVRMEGKMNSASKR